MKRFCLLILCLTILFTVNHAEAGIRALAAVPNPVAGAAVIPGKHQHVTITYDSAGNIIATETAGIALVVNAAVVADGVGQIGMLTSGELFQAGKSDPVTKLSEGQNIEGIGWNIGPITFNELKTVYCSALGQYTGDSKTSTGNFTLKGKSIYVSTTSKSKMTISAGAFSFENEDTSSSIKTYSPMTDNYSFSINYNEKYKCNWCSKVLPKDTTEPCGSSTSGHSFQQGDNNNNGSNPPSGSTPPPTTDDTPNCQDCTSHCSSPCSCTNSGTCNGTVVDNTPNCQDCTSHCSSPCSCSDSGTCNGTVAVPPPTPTPPPPTRCSEGHLYNPNNASETEAHTVSKPCKRSGCNVSMKDCQNLGGGGCFSGGKEYKYHWL